MSHVATNWAVTVRGIPPAAKVVLWHLADRHNKDTGRCDPMQETLAQDCEMSRASINNQLRILEDSGLISRFRRVNPDTNRQISTSYILHFDRIKAQDIEGRVQELDTGAVSKIETEPCLKSRESRVQNLDTNPVREPGREPVIGFSDFWEAWPNKMAKAQAEKAWKKLKTDDRRQAALSAAPWFDAWRKKHPDASPIYPATYLNGRRWEDSAPTQSHETIHQQQADAIRACSPVVKAFRPATITDLLARGFVTTDECRKAGVL